MCLDGFADLVRKAAFITLVVLGSLNAASLSALHIDQPQSHNIQCEPATARSDCHADLPHEHDAAHAGEESLFEHIFQMSREAPEAGPVFLLTPAFFQRIELLDPAELSSFALNLFTGLPPGVSRQDSQQTRAPPLPSEI